MTDATEFKSSQDAPAKNGELAIARREREKFRAVLIGMKVFEVDSILSLSVSGCTEFGQRVSKSERATRKRLTSILAALGAKGGDEHGPTMDQYNIACHAADRWREDLRKQKDEADTAKAHEAIMKSVLQTVLKEATDGPIHSLGFDTIQMIKEALGDG